MANIPDEFDVQMGEVEEFDPELEEEGSDEEQGLDMDTDDDYEVFTDEEELSARKPHLVGLPRSLLVRIVGRLSLRDIVALRKTCRHLNTFVKRETRVWANLVAYYRRTSTLLIGPTPVALPGRTFPAMQEEMLRCASIFHSQWHDSSLRPRSVSGRTSDWAPEGVEQILFVPDSVGRYFITVSSIGIDLWTLDPKSRPRMCRSLFPRVALQQGERILKVFVTHPRNSPIAYMAVQFTVKGYYRLRTEIYQLHLGPPNSDFPWSGGLCCVQMTDGTLVAFTDFVLAYMQNDPVSTITLCCWVTRQASLLAVPMRQEEVDWIFQSVRGVKIGMDVVVVVRDTSAEIYPRQLFTFIDQDQWPDLYNPKVIEGDFEYLPRTWATDYTTLPCAFVQPVDIFVHPAFTTSSISHGRQITVSVRPISLIGTANSRIPAENQPFIPYLVQPAGVVRPPVQRMATPDVSNPPSPSHTAPPSPSHTTPSPTHTARPLPEPERYRFVFHIHALPPNHERYAYGQVISGPNGRGIMLVENKNGPPRHLIAKFRHRTRRELATLVTPPQTSLDPFAPLVQLMNRTKELDVMNPPATLCPINETVRFELLTWDESGGTMIVACPQGDFVVIESTIPAPPSAA